ncbi:Uncharacterised protein [Vibrio cholerae]|nr:Uncharacterised protein [Vibrio cholerae]
MALNTKAYSRQTSEHSGPVRPPIEWANKKRSW